MKWLEQKKCLKHLLKPVPSTPITVMGLTFPNAIGLAAGLDKNGDYIDALGQLGFGFIEVGTVTPKPQQGNPQPRLFRLVKEQAIINRMGFNNKGVDYLAERIKAKRFDGIIGVNIGKNATTPLENALEDYIFCLNKVYPLADYITINISSPNTPGLRSLQEKDSLYQLLVGLKHEQIRLANDTGRYVPLVIKIAPDLSEQEVLTMADALIANKMDGVIATNTTLDRDGVKQSTYANEAGGLSGLPLFNKSTRILTQLKQALASSPIALIASGGIITAAHAEEKKQAGADLVQLYTGLIYRGPALVRECGYLNLPRVV